MALRNHRLAAVTLACFVAMAVAHSWPLASDLAGLARLDNDDAALNTWVIAWVAHVLPHNPLGLFDAPIFHPEPNTLAYSEHLFVPALMGAPFLWLGLSPVLVHNVLLIAGFALSGWVMALVMTRWTGSTAAGIVAGLVYAFNAHTLTRFPHLQAQHVGFFPLVLYCFDRLLQATRFPNHQITKSPSHDIARSPDQITQSPHHSIATFRYAWPLCAAFVLQALCSNYLLVFVSFALVAAAAVRADEWIKVPRARTALAIAGAVSVVVLTPFLWPYYEVSRDQGLTRSVEEVSRYAAGWRDYLTTGGRLHYAAWSHAFFEGRTALFPGVTALALAAVAMVTGTAWRDRRARMALAFGVLGVAFSIGPALPGYAWLHEHVPLLAGLRNAARWGWLALAAVAILAGFGASCLVRGSCLTSTESPRQHEGHEGHEDTSLGSLRDLRGLRVRDGHARLWESRSRHMLVAFAVLLVTVEAWRAPVGFTPFTGIPRIYDRLAPEERVVLAEFPFYSGASIAANGPYVLANTRHFRPLVNGYSGFATTAFEERGRRLANFPDAGAIETLRALGVTHVTVHTAAFARRSGEAALAAIDATGTLELVADEDGIRLYRLESAP